MKVENPAALRYLLQDDIYLLNADKNLYQTGATSAPVTVAEPEPSVAELQPVTPEPIAAEPQPTISKPAPEVKTPDAAFNYLGKNLKNFLILVHYPDAEFIKDAHLIALQNILKRKDLSLDDIAILNMANHSNATFAGLKAFFSPARLLVLGKEALTKDLASFKLNMPRASNNFAALHSFSFNDMMDNTEYKKIFWEQMKAL